MVAAISDNMAIHKVSNPMVNNNAINFNPRAKTIFLLISVFTLFEIEIAEGNLPRLSLSGSPPLQCLKQLLQEWEHH